MQMGCFCKDKKGTGYFFNQKSCLFPFFLILYCHCEEHSDVAISQFELSLGGTK
jgi:hypothetical protein